MTMERSLFLSRLVSGSVILSCLVGSTACETTTGPPSLKASYQPLTNPDALAVFASLPKNIALSASRGSAHVESCETKPYFNLQDHKVGSDEPLLPLVSDQAQCQSCWIHATASAIDTSRRYLTKMSYPPVSMQQLMDCSAEHAIDISVDGRFDCTSGLPEVPLHYAQKKGVRKYSDYPQISGAHDLNNNATDRNQRCMLRSPLTEEDKAASWHIATWSHVVPPNATRVAPTRDIKSALCTHGGLITWVNAKDWAKKYKNSGVETRIGGTSTSNDSPDIDYGHIVQIVGWADDKPNVNAPSTKPEGYWIIKNSWGSAWGNGGYALLRYDHEYVGRHAVWIHSAPIALPTDQVPIAQTGPVPPMQERQTFLSAQLPR